MTLLILQRVTSSLRGELTRWLMEPQAGVFIGRISALVRDKLWEKCLRTLRSEQGALLIYSSRTEQGFTVRSAGSPKRDVIDIEGLWLVRRERPDISRSKPRTSPESSGEHAL
jgi:CRISPR-associated protein Cas2